MSLPELYELQHCLVHVADVVACAIIKRQQPAADLVTKRALYREFGRGWVDKHIAPRGKIEGKRFGTACVVNKAPEAIGKIISMVNGSMCDLF